MPDELADVHALRAEGLSVAEIVARTGLGRSTVYRRLGSGPEGPRDGDELDDGEVVPGPVERSVGDLIAGRDLDLQTRAVAAEALTLARRVDELGATPTAAAGVALATVSRRLGELRAQLEALPADALSEIRERFEQRRAAQSAGGPA